MAENSTRPCYCRFYMKFISTKVALNLFDRWWDGTQEPKPTLINVQHLHTHIKDLAGVYEEIRQAYDVLITTGNSEEIAKHGSEYNAFCDRYEKIKAIGTRPEWNLEMVRKKASQSDWVAAERELKKLFHGILCAAVKRLKDN